MAAITGRMIGPAILKALGLEGQRVQKLDVHVATREAVTITTQSLMDPKQAEGFVSVLSEYNLTPKRSILSDFDGWFSDAVARHVHAH